MKRCLDLIMALALFFLFLPVMALIAILIKLTSPGPVFFLSDRVGIDNTIFKMFKFRTMKAGTPPVATHLMKNPENYLTGVGCFLRRYSLDELPQLINVIKGDMSFVGPRPALFNQDDLISLRTQKDVHRITPGITGWAQVNGRDDLPIPVKVVFDEYYAKRRSFKFDLDILLITVIRVLRKEGVQH